MADRFDATEFVAGYLVEAEEHLRESNRNLLSLDEALRQKQPHARQVRELFRSLHTLKGLSAMVGVDPVVDLAHEMESILRAADRSSGALTSEAVELLLAGVQAIEKRVAAFAQGAPVPAPPRELLDALAHVRPADASAETSGISLTLEPEVLARLSASERSELMHGAAAGKRAIRLDFSPSPALAAQGISISSVRERLGRIATVVKVLPLSVPKTERTPASLAFALLLLTEASDEALTEAGGGAASWVRVIAERPTGGPLELDELSELTELSNAEFGGRNVIRVDVERLDDALEKLSALVVTRFRVERAVARLREQGADIRELSTILSENARQLRDLRGAITRARMVSVGELLERVPLIVRGMSRTTGKRVELTINAGKAELDKGVAERVFPAIVHLVRNAVDHAIESSEQRVRSGKPEQGQITVVCYEHSNNQLELSISDDGRGIDAGDVAKRAGAPVPADDDALLELLTRPGFSTLDRATNTSGRGMGMDIVKRIAVDTLGGSLALQTQRGKGTTFTLRIPLSVSILDSFSFLCGSQPFVVPVAVVEEIIEIHAENVFRAPAPQGRRTDTQLLRRRGESVPLFKIASLFNMSSTQGEPGKALIVRRNGEPFAFAVDRMLGQQEVVVRPLEDPLVRVTGVAGTTDLGDGKPTLVLDLTGLALAAAASGREVAS